MLLGTPPWLDITRLHTEIVCQMDNMITAEDMFDISDEAIHSFTRAGSLYDARGNLLASRQVPAFHLIDPWQIRFTRYPVNCDGFIHNFVDGSPQFGGLLWGSPVELD